MNAQTPNRADRRRMRALAAPAAALMAARCYGGAPAAPSRITDPAAIAALTRAFTLMLRSGGRPMAIPVSAAEERGLMVDHPATRPDAVAWLAVGQDTAGRGCWACQAAVAPDRAVAHEIARAEALRRLAEVCASDAFAGPTVPVIVTGGGR